MLKFINLVHLVDNTYRVITDNNITIIDLYTDSVRVNIRRLLYVADGTDQRYLIDVDNLLMNVSIPNTIITVNDLLQDLMTPEMLYTYQVDDFNFSKYVRCFNNADLKNELTIEEYSIAADEPATVPDDPSHNDLRLSSIEYDLNKSIPIIDNGLKFCSWNDGKIFIKNGARLANADEVEFLSFGEAENVDLISFDQLVSNDWIIDPSRVVMLVLDGRLFYADSWVYTHSQRGKVKLNEQFIIGNEQFSNYSSVEEVTSLVDSFIIAVECRAIYIRDIPLFNVAQNVFGFNIENEPKINMNYICRDNKIYNVKSFTCIDSKYRNVSRGTDPTERHVYVGDNSGDVKLMQLTIC